MMAVVMKKRMVATINIIAICKDPRVNQCHLSMIGNILRRKKLNKT